MVRGLEPTRSPRRLGVDPAERPRPQREAAERLQTDGPNALPAERTVPGWRRFLDQYRSYMQIILLIAAVVSLAIGEWSTGAVLVLLTVVNAVVGLRQEGKAESAMNALKSLTKQTARVRRDGVESAIPAEEVVIGDVVLLTAGDDVAADGRIIAGELAGHRRVRAHRGEHAGVEGDGRARRRRAGRRRPGEHGVHEHAGDARQRRDAGDGDGAPTPRSARSPACWRRPPRNRRR